MSETALSIHGDHEFKHEELDRVMAEREVNDTQVGAAIGLRGITVWRWRRGKTKPQNVAAVIALARYLDKPVESFYGQAVPAPTNGSTS